MNKILAITAIALVAVIMGFSAVAPAMSIPNLVIIPLVKVFPQSECGDRLRVGFVCASLDRDGDEVCDVRPFKIKLPDGETLGGRCTVS